MEDELRTADSKGALWAAANGHPLIAALDQLSNEEARQYMLERFKSKERERDGLAEEMRLELFPQWQSQNGRKVEPDLVISFFDDHGQPLSVYCFAFMGSSGHGMTKSEAQLGREREACSLVYPNAPVRQILLMD